MPNIYKFEIFADYFQCIVQDESSEDDFGALWNEEAAVSMVAVGNSAISVGTLRNVMVPVEVHVLDREPAIALDEFDHVVAGAFSAPTGRLMVMGCTESFSEARHIPVAPGCYQFLYLINGVSTIENEWEPADDVYRLYMWPGSISATRVIKNWKSGAEG